MAQSLHVRWLGTVPYREALDLQTALHGGSETRSAAVGDHLLLLEHPHVYTLGVRAKPEHVLVPPASVGADLVKVKRGGDVTYHGPGQLIGYPILTLPGKDGGSKPDTVAYVTAVEQLVIDALAAVGLPGATRRPGFPGVWLGVGGENERKIAAIGVRVSKGRTMHGFAINVEPDLGMFDHIVPCGIPDKAVTSLANEGLAVTMADMVDAVVRLVDRLPMVETDAIDSPTEIERQDVRWRHRPDDLSPFSRGAGPGEPSGAAPAVAADAAAAIARQPAPKIGKQPPLRLLGRLAEAGVSGGHELATRKPDWLRPRVRIDENYLSLKKTMRDLDLVTVCEEAGCPNIFECWADGTATFMINGERCTRACGFCLVDTRKPQELDADEPDRVAEAVARMGLAHAVVTAVARDDLADGGAQAFADTIAAIRRRSPATQVEVLIPDCKGDTASLDVLFDARPDVLNHNMETVARLQRAVRPNAGYARSLAVLARAKAQGLTTKSGLIAGMGEEPYEVRGALADLAAIGIDIVTIGQYLRPTSNHLPVDRWVEPQEFDDWATYGMSELGIPHVESSPLTRSSYHAREAAEAGLGSRRIAT